jgi:hypothetical protein
MNDKADDTNVLENIEWISMRWHNAPETSKPRMLLVGDSIVAGHGAQVYELLKESLCVDFFATSKHITNSDYMSDLDFMLHKSSYELILFNNGLHGFDVDDKYYKKSLFDALSYLKTKTPCLCWRSSTPILSTDLNDFHSEKNPRVISRNSDADQVAYSLKLASLDIYTPMAENKSLFCQDAVHYTPEGQKIQAGLIANFINER